MPYALTRSRVTTTHFNLKILSVHDDGGGGVCGDAKVLNDIAAKASKPVSFKKRSERAGPLNII